MNQKCNKEIETLSNTNDDDEVNYVARCETVDPNDCAFNRNTLILLIADYNYIISIHSSKDRFFIKQT